MRMRTTGANRRAPKVWVGLVHARSGTPPHVNDPFVPRYRLGTATKIVPAAVSAPPAHEPVTRRPVIPSRTTRAASMGSMARRNTSTRGSTPVIQLAAARCA